MKNRDKVVRLDSKNRPVLGYHSVNNKLIRYPLVYTVNKVGDVISLYNVDMLFDPYTLEALADFSPEKRVWMNHMLVDIPTFICHLDSTEPYYTHFIQEYA